MVGRNDPCTCGSGKKYKNCCLKNEKVSPIDAQVDQELDQVISNFFSVHPTEKEKLEIYKWIGEKETFLSERFENDKVSAIMGDCYYFTHRVDIWNNYIEREINKTKRPRVKLVIENWINPTVILSRIMDIQPNKQAKLQNVFTNETLEIAFQSNFEGGVGDFVFGHFLPDKRRHDPFYTVLNSLIVFPSKDTHLVDRVFRLFETSGSDSLQAFFNDFIIDCYKILGEKEANIEDVFNEKELQLITTLHNCLVEMDVKSDQLMYVFIEYLQKNGIAKNVKKPNAFVAGALQMGIYCQLIPVVWSKKEIANFLDVSTSTANKYEEMLGDFYTNEISMEAFNENPTFAFEVGTDATHVEFVNWQLGMHLNKSNIKNEKEMSRYIDIYKNKPYEPTSDSEKAQKYAYEAYTSRIEGERKTLSLLAYEYDKSNVDALLLKAESLEKSEQVPFYQKAIQLGEKQFDRSFEVAWGYLPNRPYLRALFKCGLRYFEQKEYKEAFNLLNKILLINPGDHQGARYPAVAALVALRRFEEAESLMKHYQESDNAFFSWFRWVIAKKKNFFSKETQDAFQLAMEDNAYVAKYLREKAETLSYPHSIAITPDSPEEGKVIWTLLQPLV